MILVTGGSGRLGACLRGVFPAARFPARSELDVRDEQRIERALRESPPEVLIHAAAMTDVRRSQQDRETCWDVNVAGTERLVSVLQRVAPQCHFVYISTACVFQGDQGEYDEKSIPWPKNFYGLSKLLAETIARRMASHLVIRTNFVAREPWPYPRAFVDRFGTYLFADDVARGIGEFVEQRLQGLVHLAGDRRMSMFELAQLTSPGVEPMTMAECDLPLTVDMTLRSCRVAPRRIATDPPSGP